MALAGFEPAFPTNEQPQAHALDGEATAIGLSALWWCIIFFSNEIYFYKRKIVSV
jgi:hypothetical protein